MLGGGDGCAEGGGGVGGIGGGVGGGVGVGTGVDGLAARAYGVPGRHPVAGGIEPPCHGARREESNLGPRQQGAAGADHHRA